eukprot:5132000-Lingulodinium_polyedra.AAC.1
MIPRRRRRAQLSEDAVRERCADALRDPRGQLRAPDIWRRTRLQRGHFCGMNPAILAIETIRLGWVHTAGLP